MNFQLDHIDFMVCPTCSAEMMSVSKSDKHCNGHHNETITFKCGSKFHFSPNYMVVRETHLCPKNPKEVEKISTRKISLGLVKAYIKKLKCDKEFVEILLKQLEYTHNKI